MPILVLTWQQPCCEGNRSCLHNYINKCWYSSQFSRILHSNYCSTLPELLGKVCTYKHFINEAPVLQYQTSNKTPFLLRQKHNQIVGPTVQNNVLSCSVEGWRFLALDFKGLAWFINILPFYMLKFSDVIQAVQPQDWFIVVDLHNIYTVWPKVCGCLIMTPISGPSPFIPQRWNMIA